MEYKDSNAKKQFLLSKKVLGLIVLIVVAIYIFWLFQKYQSQKEQERKESFNQSLDASLSLLKSDSPDAISELEKTVNLSASEDERAASKVLLGAGYLFKKDIENLKKGIMILKEVADDESYPPRYRTKAIMYIAGVYSFTLDAEFAKSYIFSGGEPWESFLKNGDGDVNIAVRGAYEWANSINPTALASYGISFWYADQLLEARLNASPIVLTKEQKESYVDLLEANLKLGDEAIATIIVYGTMIDDPLGFAHINQFRGIAYDKYTLLNNTASGKDSAETAFKIALETLNSPDMDSSASARSVILFINYHYAVFLGHLTSGKLEDRADDIKAIMDIIMQDAKTDSSFVFYFQNLGRTSSDVKRITKEGARMLANIDSRFGKFLEELGW